MWYPVELHSQDANRGGLLGALVEELSSRPHYLLVTSRQISGQLCDESEDGARQTAVMLDQCSTAYVGTHHMAPVAPYSAFTLAPDIGVAYLEYFIDYNPLPTKVFDSHTISSPLHDFATALFREHQEIHTIVLPMPTSPVLDDHFEQHAVGEHYYLVRIERAAQP